MADFMYSPQRGGNYYDSEPQRLAPAGSNQLVTLTNMAGAVMSLALIIGVGVWGYKLMVRDVSGIPVVRAASSEMRIRPEEPGGQLARHQGLSVNAVAAAGTAEKPADRLILAPKPIDLTAEDQAMPASMVASAPQAGTTEVLPSAPSLQADEVTAALESGDVADLVAKLTAGVAPLTDLSSDAPSNVAATVNEAIATEVESAALQLNTAAGNGGLTQSIRPKKRPNFAAVVTPAALNVTDSPAVSTVTEIDPSSLPAGTRLAQLGAFDSAEVAREQWGQLENRFEAYLKGKKRIVQKATSGGRVFYRLRAAGFEDIADARRFCSALVAQNSDCIPVVTR